MQKLAIEKQSARSQMTTARDSLEIHVKQSSGSSFILSRRPRPINLNTASHFTYLIATFFATPPIWPTNQR